MLDRDIDLLRPLPIFAHFDEDQLRLIAFSAERKEFESGAVVFREGELADSGLLVMEGSVLMTEAVDGEEVERAIYGPGSLIGELALLTPTQRPATAIARADSTFMVITRGLIRRILEEYPAAARELQAYLRERLTHFNEDLKAARLMESAPAPGALN